MSFGSTSTSRWPFGFLIAAKAEGIEDVFAALDRHDHYLQASGTLVERRRKRLRDRVVEIVERTVQQRLWQDAGTNDWLKNRIPELESGSTNPFAVAHELVARSGDLMTGRTR